MIIVSRAEAPPVELTPAQAAAAAKIAFAVEVPGAVVVLCGPPGVGKTTVLAHLTAAAAAAGRFVERCSPAAVADGRIEATHRDVRGTQPDPTHEILLVDDAHETDLAGLADLLGRCRRVRPATAVVLAGEGRLMSLVAGDTRLEQSIRLRATLPAFSFADTGKLLAGRPATSAAGVPQAAVLRTIHEIAGGVPAVSLRLAEVADMVAVALPRPLTVYDIEMIHRRLSLSAA